MQLQKNMGCTTQLTMYVELESIYMTRKHIASRCPMLNKHR